MTLTEPLGAADPPRGVATDTPAKSSLGRGIAGLGREIRSQPALALIAAVAFAAVTATNLISLGFDHLHTSVINANWEFSWSHDVDTLLLGIGVCVSLIGAHAGGAHRRLWFATAGILALFFLDEVSALHGQIGNVDKLLYVPILAALVVSVWRLSGGTGERLVVGAGFVTLLLAFAMHVAGLHLLRPIGYTTYIYQAGVGFKEGTELAGLILVVAGLWRLAQTAGERHSITVDEAYPVAQVPAGADSSFD